VESKGYTVSVKARGNYPQQSVVLVVSASTGVRKLTCRCREAVKPIPLFLFNGEGGSLGKILIRVKLCPKYTETNPC
jgi:hypothetical protein